MKTLQINPDYPGNHLYSYLFGQLEKLCDVSVYVPTPTAWKDRSFDVSRFTNSQLCFSPIVRPIHRILYKQKIQKACRDLIKRGLHENVDFVHAHSLLFAGGIAQKLKCKFGLRYLVAVRLTDVTSHYPRRLHLRPYMRSILRDAEKIVFTSPEYRDRLLGRMSRKCRVEFLAKSIIVPNGISPFWQEHLCRTPHQRQPDKLRVIYVGFIQESKGVERLIAAMDQLNRQTPARYELTIVGGPFRFAPEYHDQVLEKYRSLPWVTFRGRIDDPMELLRAYRSADVFAMPARDELFGLVFIEALSQGIPVLYPKDEGITEFLDGQDVGESVNPNCVDSIAEGLKTIDVQYDQYSGFSELARRFDWKELSARYKELYDQYS